MTITAEKANEIANRVCEERKVEERENALAYLEKEIEPVIKKQAEDGRFSAHCDSIPFTIYDIATIDEELSSRGFRVFGKLRENFIIRW